MESFLVWLGVTALIVLVLYFGRGTTLQRKLRLSDINLTAAVIFAGLLALIPAIFVSQTGRSTADVPESVADDAATTAGAPKTRD